jgi:hypothetical protein
MIDILSFIFLIVWFVAMMLMPWLKAYKSLLVNALIVTSTFTIYAYLKGEYAAASVTAISFLAVISQIVLPSSDKKSSKATRNILAIIFSVIAVILLYEKFIDILPCAGTAVTRLSEAQQSPVIYKLGYVIGIILWAIFGYYAGLYLLCAFQFIILLSYMAHFLTSQKKDAYSTTQD